MLPISTEYYGDNARWFIGTVIDNTPPYGLEGKVKIHIDGIHSTDTNDIPHKDLPWAQVLMPANTGGASGHGSIPQLVPNSRVFGIFLDGVSSQLPLVLGHLHTTEIPTLVQYKNILIPDEPDDVEQNVEFAAKYFLNLGYRPHIAATIIGAADTVSGLDPTTESNGRFGLLQWTVDTPRYQSLLDYADAFSTEYGYEDFVTQLAFIAYELRTNRSEVVGNLRRTNEIDDKPVKINSAHRRARYIGGLGSASMFVKYFDKSYQPEIINQIAAIRGKSKGVLNQIV